MFSTISRIAIEFGLPLIKKVMDQKLSGNISYLAEGILSKIMKDLGIRKNDPKCEDLLLTAYRDKPDVVRSVFHAQEEEAEIFMKEFEFLSDHYKDVNKTIRSETSSESFITRFWRPFFGIVYGICFLSFWLSVIVLMLFYDVSKINAIMELSGITISLFGMGASVLGVYAWRRSDEKIKR